jgi:hypothetical protein
MQLQDKTPKQLADMIATRINIGGVLVVVNPHPAYGWHPTVMTAPAHAIKCQQIAEQVATVMLPAERRGSSRDDFSLASLACPSRFCGD